MNMTINITDIEALIRVILHNKSKITLLNEMYTVDNEDETYFIVIVKIEYIRSYDNPYNIVIDVDFGNDKKSVQQYNANTLIEALSKIADYVHTDISINRIFKRKNYESN